MDVLAYFSAQSQLTDPGAKSELFAPLPKTVPELCSVVEGLCLHFGEIYKYPIQNERELETNCRYIEAVVEKIYKLYKHPLTEARPVDRRFVASSSDFANLLCSMARYQGIPTRKRVGFIPVEGGFRCHDITEYWDGGWKQADASGMLRGEFIPAAKAWQDCRSGKADAKLFANEEHCGLEIVRAALILDLAAMQKIELLGWDRYGWMQRPFADFSDKAWAILDKAAELLLAGDEALEALQALYAGEEGLQVSRVIFCDTPLVPPHKVELKL